MQQFWYCLCKLNWKIMESIKLHLIGFHFHHTIHTYTLRDEVTSKNSAFYKSRISFNSVIECVCAIPISPLLFNDVIWPVHSLSLYVKWRKRPVRVDEWTISHAVLFTFYPKFREEEQTNAHTPNKNERTGDESKICVSIRVTGEIFFSSQGQSKTSTTWKYWIRRKCQSYLEIQNVSAPCCWYPLLILFWGKKLKPLKKLYIF